MEDIIAVRAVDTTDRRHEFLVWGGAFGSVEYEQLLNTVRLHIRKFGINPEGIELSILPTIGLASASPYFFECLTRMILSRVAFLLRDANPASPAWLSFVKEELIAGREIYYLG